MNIWRIILALPFCVLIGVSSSQAMSISGQGTWESTLHARDLDGNASTIEAYFDSTLGITWLADANYAATSGYAALNAVEFPADEPGAPAGQHRDNISADGRMGWNAANSWAEGLVIGAYDDWRLPTQSDWRVPDSIVDEMSIMRDITLGNDLLQPLTNTGPFSNVQLSNYWSSTPRSADRAYVFNFNTGDSYYDARYWGMYAWAVHEGDIGNPIQAIPIPAAIWLFSPAVVMLLRFRRKTENLSPTGS